jgi:hypothetical protein
MRAFLRRPRKELLGGLVALAIAGAGTHVSAADQTESATSTPFAISSSFQTPVIASEAPPRPDSGPNPGDAARADMQHDPQSFAMMGKHFPPAPDAGNVAGVDASNVAIHGRGGYDRALVELQAVPRPLPWMARKDAKDTTASASSAK